MTKELTAEEVQAKLDGVREKVGRAVDAVEAEGPANNLGLPVEEEGEAECQDCGAPFTFQAIKTRGGQVHRGTRCDACYAVWRHAADVPVVREDPTLLTPAVKVERSLEALDAMGVNVRQHGHLKIEELEDQGAVAKAMEFVRAALKAGKWRSTNGLYIHGPTGTGKSQLAVSVIRKLIEAGWSEKAIVYDRGRAMITQLQDCYGTNTVDAFSERRRRCKLWVYEDIGTEKLTPDAFRVLEDILDRREGHPTIMTSNLTRKQMAQRWEDVSEGWGRLLSRLHGFDPILVKGVDRRGQKRRGE